MPLRYNEVTPKKIIALDDEPYEVLDSKVFRKQQAKPVNQTRLRSLSTGRVLEKTFQAAEKAEEAEVEKKPALFLYTKPGRAGQADEHWFSDPKDKSKRFSLSSEEIGPGLPFLRQNLEVETLSFQEKIIKVILPIKVELEVVEAPPATKGDTASGGTKQVVLETGARVTTPLFIEAGEKIIVNTETGQYVERAK